ncbi:MAG: thiamine diphosphokinase [Anaerolineales bacterium]
MHAIVFANGDLNSPPDLKERLAAADLIVAADGGALHCRSLGILPDVVIGDLDSLDTSAQTEFESQGVRILQHPADKDQTDLELALEYVKTAGAKEVLVLGGLGRRWDHSFANLLLAAHDQFSSLRILFLVGQQRLFIIRGRGHFEAAVGERISLLPLGGDAEGVSTHGLQFPLVQETLVFGSSRGLSNVVLTEGARVELVSGCLLTIIFPPELG